MYPLKTGTVQLEISLGKDVLATVVTEPRLHPREAPGILRLHIPLSVPDLSNKGKSKGKEKGKEGKEGGEGGDGDGETEEIENNNKTEKILQEIELWSRCAPEGMTFRIGDVIQTDIQHFRPEKLQFARNIRMKGYRQIGRRTGRVTAIKDSAYGFIRITAPFTHNGLVDEREDCYFRASEVAHGTTGAMLPVEQIVVSLQIEEGVRELLRYGDITLYWCSVS